MLIVGLRDMRGRKGVEGWRNMNLEDNMLRLGDELSPSPHPFAAAFLISKLF
jgi:hypothetical protein